MNNIFYTFKWFYLLLILSMLAGAACEKEDFTEPVSVDLKVGIAEGTHAHVSFNGGMVRFKQIWFDGQRNQGGNVYFTTNKDRQIQSLNFSAKEAGYVKRFDIPQGVYSRMEWSFELDELDEDDNDMPDDFDGGLVITGSYRRPGGILIPIYFVVDEDERIAAISQGASESENITLLANKSYEAQLILDPYYAFQPVTLASLQATDIEEDDVDNPYIEISSDENKSLYESIIFRFEKSVKVIIK
ncbi:hypothetical protein SAMN06265379_101584 [Saccharicrinis carchari]|uniref:DUF4382 domain-containing protein n=1 Tax=Saccharicrinis carchari TaxID=1168039 RepID=A0A521B1D6_SACCC|nr:hypothetical protein [Saccharicrinis carchari]SMO40904.1 hypothetical protein SAMN06265379_101584 [Saccharicrinis carchari]